MAKSQLTLNQARTKELITKLWSLTVPAGMQTTLSCSPLT